MDAALLTDPAFWSDPNWYAPAGLPAGVLVPEGEGGQVLFQTSGSSGRPKWVALPKEALLLSAAAVNRHLRVREDSVWGLALPLHHVGGFGVMARAFEAACEWSRFKSKWDARGCSRWLEDSGVSHLSLVPTQVHDLVAGGIRAPDSLKAVVVGGGRLDVEMGQKARDLGWPVLASYGMTEACSQIATQSIDLLDASYITDDIPVLPIWKVALTADGRLRISGPALFSGLLEESCDGWKFTPRRGEWYETADRVSVKDGGLTPLGRADLLVKVLGELVSPEMIERDLEMISNGSIGIGRYAIIAVPSERKGNRLIPVFERPVDEVAVAELLEVHNGRVAGFMRLENPVFLDSFPRGDLGKLRRGELARMIEIH